MKPVGSAARGPSLPPSHDPHFLQLLLGLLPALCIVVGRLARSMNLPCVAEDIVQESIVRLLRSGTFLVTQTKTLFAYLYRTSHNLLIDEKRRRSHTHFVSLDVERDDGS